MSKADDDGITTRICGAPSGFKTILFLPGATPAVVVAGAERSEGWVGQCPVAEADDLCWRRLAICFSDDWPMLPAPAARGEPLPNFIEREVFGHPTVTALMQLGASAELKAPIISPVRPGERTVQWWSREYPPDRRFYWIEDHYRGTTLFYYLKYLIWRLMVQLFDQLRDGKWVVFGLLAGDAEYFLKPVGLGPWRHPDMVLNYSPRGDWFRPEQRRGWPVPTGLPAYGGLILHDASQSSITRPGTQGRPTSVDHLIRPELARRRDAHQTLSTMTAEAEALSQWLAKTHPHQPQVGGPSLMNALREELRAAVGAVKQQDIK